jgi:HD-GYP domain-containing protein (c-di-GMP phosphodiesterase class II)
MANNDNDAIEAVAQSLVDDAEHYVGEIAAISEKCEMVAVEDIISTNGTKLVARGTRIDSRLREKLCGHKLAGLTLEKCLAIEGSVTSASLVVDMERVIHKDSWLRRLAARSGDSGAIRYDVSALRLPREILFRLSVARDQRPQLYSHALSVAAICHYLALRMQLKQSAINSLLIAALCHDLGELYVDQALLEPGHRITNEERRFIYVHPIVGWLIVRDLPAVHRDVASAIIQHQERLDGSGYPYGKRAEEILLPGRILGAADVAASIMARFGDHRRLSALLRLNNKKYDAKVVALLYDSTAEEAPAAVQLERGVLGARLAAFASVLDGWARLRAASEIANSAPVDLITERMFNLRSVVVQFGFDPDSLDIPLKLAEEDATIAAELTAVVDELQFQLTDLGREFDRNSPDWLSSIDPLMATGLEDWRRQLQDCIDG